MALAVFYLVPGYILIISKGMALAVFYLVPGYILIISKGKSSDDPPRFTERNN